MKKNSIILIFVLSIILLHSCTKDFNKVYSDPEALPQTSAGYFLNDILYKGVNVGLGQALYVNNELAQVTVSTKETNELHRYIIRSTVSDNGWNNYYPLLNNLQDMRLAAKRDKHVNSEAISLVLWAWLYQNITDTYGDIPYTQALHGYPDYLIQPVFDRQYLIYQDLVNKLDTANSMLASSGTLETGSDLLYQTDVEPSNMIKWKKLGNSLRLRLLMRIANKSPDAQRQINMILSNPLIYPVMVDNTDAATVRYSNVAPFINPFANARTIDWNGLISISKFFIDSLMAWDDPRLPLWCTQANGDFIGIPSGFSREEQSIASTPASTLLTTLKSSSLTGQIMQYAEVEFIRAEAILKGYTMGNAQTAYENGIRASLGYWGAKMPSDFLTRAGIAYNGTLEQVFTQKYFALFFNDMQQWFEIRRTGFPKLPKGSATINKQLPSRLTYPLLIQSSNAENYKQELSIMGTDTDTSKVWWQQ